MPWLAFVVGRNLLDTSRARRKHLRFIEGERVIFAYPHKVGEPPQGIKTIADARKYPWKGEPPQWIKEAEARIKKLSAKLKAQEAKRDEFLGMERKDISDDIDHLEKEIKKEELAVNMHREGPRVADLYNITASQLGFRKAGKNNPWRNWTKDPKEFGKATRSTASDQAKFDASTAQAISSLGGM